MRSGLRSVINEKHAKLAMLLGFVLLFVFLLPILMMSGVPTVISVNADEGYMDFSGLQAKNQNAIYRLEGEWEYYPHQLLSSADFANQVGTVQYASFPHYWKDSEEFASDVTGCATYRLIGKKSAGSDSVGLYSRFQFGAYKVFINGMEVVKIGKVSESPSEYYMSYQSGNGYVCPAEAENFEIIIQIQNFDHVMAGFTGPIFYGDMDQIKFFIEFLLILNGIMVGFLLLLFGYFTIVYIQDRKKTLYLNFAVVTLMSLFITMTTCNESITYSIVPLVSPHIIFKLEYVTQIIAALFSTQYIAKKYMNHKVYLTATNVLCIAITIALFIAPSMEISKFRIQFQLVASSLYVAPLFLAVRAMIVKKSKNAFWELLSLLMLISGIGLTKLGVILWNSVDVFPILMTMYCFIQVVVLLYYYSGIEEDIKSLNQNLEHKIEERTRELFELTQKAESAATAKSDFLALMSHEIRTPMNAIIGMSDLIQTDNLNDTQKLYFRDIKTVSHSLLNIVNDILDFSKIESGKFQITPVHFNFYSMIDNICSLFYYSAKAKGLRFESNIDISIPNTLFQDETRIRQAVSNILSNAIKYTSKGTVKFTVDRTDEGRGILFCVTDTGVGIKQEDLPRLFSLFEQLDKSHSKKGTGLGLAICKQLAELMDGTVSVESEYGVGSTFKIHLPLVEGDASLVEMAEIKERIYGRGARVLVVDDNSVNLTVAKGILETHDIMPDTAESGEAAIEMVKQYTYDMIFMDHMMPGMDGLETTSFIRSLGARYEVLPIIALTANAVSGSREYLMDHGMTDFISKPIDRVALNTMLAKWLPFDKIETRVEHEEAEAPQLEGYLLMVSEVPGLDVLKGLSHVGNHPDTYKTVLNQFIYETPAYIDNLVNAELAEDAELYAVVVHGLKGSLNSIGAGWLGDWAFSLEKSAKAGDMKTCIAQTEKFTASVFTLIKTLEPLMKETEQAAEPETKRQMPLEQLRETLESLKTACILGDCSTIDDIVAALKHAGFEQDYENAVADVIRFAEHMEYSEAAERIESVLTA